MSWERLSAVRVLRDERGTVVLEELDDDARTATFRIYGRTALTARNTAVGIAFDGPVPPVLRAALAPPAFGRFVAASHWP
jgi:Arc/MetJ family transcription regulator